MEQRKQMSDHLQDNLDDAQPTPTIHVEVAYARPDVQKIISLELPKSTTAREAVKSSGVGNLFPEIDIDNCPLGIFGHALGARGMSPAEEYKLNDGDRVEIYRPLIADPKEVRKKRAAEAAARKQAENTEG
jgi:putative ubiquitin-RnfH superfamily antitoxin RatB of RatAB toxin-antitoxin module